MRSRLRARVLSVPLLGLLLVAFLAAPAFAWHVEFEAYAECADDGVLVSWFVGVPEGEDWTASDVDIWYTVGDDATPYKLVEDGFFSADNDAYSGEFTLPGGAFVTIHVKVDWDDGSEQPYKAYKKVKLPTCKTTTSPTTSSTTTSTTTSTTMAPTTTQAPTTTGAPTTAAPTTAAPTTAAPTTTPETTVVVVPSTTKGVSPGLPFTGASTLPLLLGGALLLVAGFAVLKATKARAASANSDRVE